MRRSGRILAFALLPTLPALVSACGSGPGGGDAPAISQTGGGPQFQVDPTWPREMPNDWIMGAVTSVFVDSRDHVWVTHLQETLTPEETAPLQDPADHPVHAMYVGCSVLEITPFLEPFQERLRSPLYLIRL